MKIFAQVCAGMEKSCGYVATRRILAVQNALGSQKFHDVSSILHSDFKLDAQKIILFCQDGRQSSLPDLSVQNIHILPVCEKPITLAVVQLAHDTDLFQIHQCLIHCGYGQAGLFDKPGCGNYGAFL